MNQFRSSVGGTFASTRPASGGRGLLGGSAWPAAWRRPAPRRVYQVAGQGTGSAASGSQPATADAAAAARQSEAAEEEPETRRMRLEAVLFLAKSPLTMRKLAQLANLADGTEARTLVRSLNQVYDATGRALRVEQVAGGYRLLTRPALSPWLARLSHLPPAVQLSSPMMETLAVVAYRQPASRADVEAVRGVACGELLRQLMQRDLIRITGRSEELGRPYLYGTTKRFLQLFGLPSSDALPEIDLQALQEDVPDSEVDDAFESPAPDSSTSPKESVVSTAVAPALPGADPETDAPAGAAGTLLPAAPESPEPTAVIEDEEDDLYEGTVESDDEDELDDDEDELAEELDEEEWEDEDDEDLEDVEDEDEDDDDVDEVDNEWEEVDDSDEEDDWDDDDDDWDEDDVESEDDDEDWD